MPRLKIAIVALFALVLSIEPVFHNHTLPASGTSPTPCAVCSTGADRVTIEAPAVTAPAVVLFTLIAPPPVTISTDVLLPLSSRAPPAA